MLPHSLRSTDSIMEFNTTHNSVLPKWHLPKEETDSVAHLRYTQTLKQTFI
jgi:hypothetical protein